MKDSTQDRHGSPPVEATAGEGVYLAIGTLGRLHGVHGEIVFHILTDFPERIKSRMQVYVGESTNRSASTAGASMARTCCSPLKASVRLRRRRLCATKWYSFPARPPPLEEGEYYFHEVMGLQVIDEGGLPLGNIVEILATGANDVYVVRKNQVRTSCSCH